MRSIWKIGKVQILSETFTKYSRHKKHAHKFHSEKIYRDGPPVKQAKGRKPFYTPPKEIQEIRRMDEEYKKKISE